MVGADIGPCKQSLFHAGDDFVVQDVLPFHRDPQRCSKLEVFRPLVCQPSVLDG